MIPANETFDGTFPFKPHFSQAPGFRMHYTDEGAGEAIICLHGEPTWGYLYRNFIPPLSKDFRVIVPDHMGFGKSETPQDREYSLKAHTENLAALIDDLGLGDITFVMQDWGGPIGSAYTVRHPHLVKRLCYMNTICGYSAAVRGKQDDSAPKPPSLRTSPWFQWVINGHENGSYYEVMKNLRSTVLSVMKIIGFTNSAAVTPAWIRAYSAPFETEMECKAAIEFPLDVALNRIADYVKAGFSGVEALRRIPAMMAEGLEDRSVPPQTAMADFKAVSPKGPIVTLENVGHFCQEDAPATLVALIRQFIQMNP